MKMTGGNPLFVVKFCDSLLKTELVTLSKLNNNNDDNDTNDKVATFRMDEMQHDINFVLPLPYKVQRIISTYLDRLDPPEGKRTSLYSSIYRKRMFLYSSIYHLKELSY